MESVSQLHSDPILTFNISPDGQSILTGSADEYISKLSLNVDPKSSAGIIKLPNKGTSSLEYRSDGKVIASAHWDHTVRLFDRKKFKPLVVLRQHRDIVNVVTFQSDSSLFASASKDGTIALWDLFSDSFRL